MADERTYITLTDGMPDHPKVVAAGGDAAWLQVCAIAYCSRNRTDGHVPAQIVVRLSDRKQPKKLAAKLVDVGLWHAPGHDCERCPQITEGYYVHDYLEHQRSAEQIADLRRKRAEAGRKGGSVSRPKVSKTEASASGGASDVLQANTEAKQKPIEAPTDAPTEVPPTEVLAERPNGRSGASKPRRQRHDDQQSPNAGDVVAAWVEGAEQTTGERPASRLVAQVGRQARELIAEGKDPARLIAAARAAGSKGFADLPRELLKTGANGRAPADATSNPRDHLPEAWQ